MRRKTPGTFIRLKIDTKHVLDNIGKKNESYDDVIRKLLKQKRIKL